MPQPIDINTELARTTAAQRVQEIADRASLAAQHRQAHQVLQEQVDAETVVQQPPESDNEAAVTDSRERDADQRKKRERSETKSADSNRTDHGAGDLEVIPDSEHHRLDVNV